MARDYYDRDRNMWDRSRDEVRSWFGDEEAERRRLRDQHEIDWEEQSRMRGNPYRERDYRQEVADSEFDRDWDLDDRGSYGPFRNDRPLGGWHGRQPQSNYGGSRGGRWGTSGDQQDMSRRTGRYRDMESGMDSGMGTGPYGGRRQGGGGSYRYRDEYMGHDRGQGRHYPDYRREEMGSTEDFSGRGPGGYRRSDDRIREDLNEALTWDWRLDATDINVEVSEGVATLTGHVRDRRMKRRAEDIIDSIRGVRDVHNRLSVSGTGGSAATPSNANAGTHGKGDQAGQTGQTGQTREGTQQQQQQQRDRNFKV